MKKIIIILIVGCLLLCCNRQPKFFCNNHSNQFDFEYCGYENIGPTEKQIDSFEQLKGSIKINYTSSDITPGYNLSSDCFFVPSYDDMYPFPLLYLRPTNHPFLKYIVAYFNPIDESDLFVIGKVYYKDHILDTLLPDSIQKKYAKAKFDLNDMLCLEKVAIQYYDSLYKLNAEWRAFKKDSEKKEECYFKEQQRYYYTVLKERPDLKHIPTLYDWECHSPYAGATITIDETMISARNYDRHILKDGRRINDVEYLSNRITREERETSISISDTVQITDLCLWIQIYGNPYKLVY